MDQTAALQQAGVLNYLTSHPVILVVMVVWIIFWKGLALWKAARLSHKWWFMILLVANTIGILEIIYIYFVARKFVVEEETQEEIEDADELE